jgi:hypothetical protein
MLRNLPVSVLALLVVAGGCARHTIPPVVLVPQGHIGPADEYGLSIADVTLRDKNHRGDRVPRATTCDHQQREHGDRQIP